MKYLLVLLLLTGCGDGVEITKHKNIVINTESNLKVGDCFEVVGQEGLFYKIRSVLKLSYLAGRYGGDKDFNKKYPAVQITSVSKQQPIYTTDCMKNNGKITEEFSKKWNEAIINEYNDRKSRYDKDARVPGNGK